jgi:hypothetical protein
MEPVYACCKCSVAGRSRSVVQPGRMQVFWLWHHHISRLPTGYPAVTLWEILVHYSGESAQDFHLLPS